MSHIDKLIHLCNNRVVAETLTRSEQNPIILLGGGDGTGRILAKKLAQDGRQLYIGTRSEDKFLSLRDEIVQSGGIEPRPFIADLTNPEQLDNAYSGLDLEPGQAVDYLDFPAAGFDKTLMIPVAMGLGRLKKELDRTGEISLDSAINVSNKFKELTTNENAHEVAREVNIEAPIKLAQRLLEDKHLDSTSTIAVLSSTISKYTGNYTQENYPGPWLYYVVGRNKSEGAKKLNEFSNRIGSLFLDFVAPEISDTTVGKILANYKDVFKALHVLSGSQEEFIYPEVTTEQVTRVIVAELARSDRNSRDVYILPDGSSQNEAPKGWDKHAFSFA